MKTTPQPAPPRIAACGLAVGYRQRRRVTTVARDITLEAHTGQLVALLGANGVGKSTVLRTLTGIQAPLAGAVQLDGEPLAALSPAARARRLAVVLTDRVEGGHLDVYTLVGLGRHPHTGTLGRLRAEDERAIRAALEAMEAMHLAGRFVDELSDGEKQKVMIARALAQEPRVLVLDEPTAFLDVPHRMEVMRVLRRVTRARGQTAIVSTHHVDLALRAADRLWVMRAGQPIAAGAPEDLVLDGTVAAAFAARDVAFDHDTGGFALRFDAVPVCRVHGPEPARAWTVRALEREGHAEVAASSTPVWTVTVERRGDAWQWTWTRGARSATLDTIAALLGHIVTETESEDDHGACEQAGDPPRG